MTSEKQVRILTLNDGDIKDSTLYRLQNGWFVHFMLGPTLVSKNVTVYCNHPTSSNDSERNFRLLDWKNTASNVGDQSDAYATFQICIAGTFQYYAEINAKVCASGYFVVDPVLLVGPDDHVLPLDSVCMQTVLPKSLGPFSEWSGRLKVSFKTGYNVIHLTPIQKLGISNSSYCIEDQLELNPAFSKGEPSPISWNDLGCFIDTIKKDWNMLTVTDVVWNHTAKNSGWLELYPQCAFNLVNCPHLRPAYLLDRALYYLALDIGKGTYVKRGISKIDSENHLKILEAVLLTEVIPDLKLWEFCQVDVDATVLKFEEEIAKIKNFQSQKLTTKTISIIQDTQFRRLKSTIDIPTAVCQFYLSLDKPDIDEALKNLISTLVWLNRNKKLEVQEDMLAAVRNIISTIRYERLDDTGPKKVEISESIPLVTEYFYHSFPDATVEQDEMAIENPDHAKYIMAHNGWVMGADPMKNFAEYPTKTYFRRELVSWGDSVKLNYGSSPDHCPVLWKRMKQYTEITAKHFHGIRIDNCHSTPIHVAEYMLAAARKIKPDLYVFAELFTGNEELDNIFVNKLGINSLIREGMVAWNSQELGRLVHKYGGEPVASFVQPNTRPLVPSLAHALLYDVTHDNESAIKKRTLLDPLPFSALVTMACCAVGSNRGHDELVPHHIHVVEENRSYASWKDWTSRQDTSHSKAVVGEKNGILNERRTLNHLHQTMAINGFSQVFVDQRDADVIVITRHSPTSHQSYVLVAHTAFVNTAPREVQPLKIEGHIEGIAFEAKPNVCNDQYDELLTSFEQHYDVINGVEDFKIISDCDVPLDQSHCCVVKQISNAQEITFTDFPPGSVIVFRVKLNEIADDNANKIKLSVKKLLINADKEFDNALAGLDLCALHRVLFRCDDEEKSDGLQIGAYDFAGWGSLKYCGMQGIMSVMAKIRANNDLGHPICNNLREGNWLLEYIFSRLQKHQETKRLGDWFESVFDPFTNLPRYLVPAYFDIFLIATYVKLLNACWNQMSTYVSSGSPFVKTLALGSVALYSVIKESGMPKVAQDQCDAPSLAAGLPHFSTGIMRCWGRDTFIALKGLLLIPGRYDDAKSMVLGFASTVRHGLIPNLLGEGRICRYNCRDAVWWWLQCIQDICEMCDNEYDFLQTPVGRIYPTDDTGPVLPPEYCQPLCDIMQECLQCHVNGIAFRERGAGVNIDQNMSTDGFNVTAGIDVDTGFVYGGNKHNCGTWMDKMGESEKAKTKSIPSTPRDGSAVELVGLCKSTVNWLLKANNIGKYPYDGVFVKGRKTSKLSWCEWNNKIQANFEKHFFVSEQDMSPLVHKRFIYKDSVGASHSWCDYQLRPNFPIAMVVAPELFTTQHAWQALEITQEKLLGPLGIKTLDPDDMMYRGDYDNGNDSTDSSIAKGFNYHQGPEWVWPVGYLFRAKLYFANQLGKEVLSQTIEFIRGHLANHQIHVETSLWKGLPELTNNNGAWCRDSCEIQAWSNATILEVMYDLEKYNVQSS